MERLVPVVINADDFGYSESVNTAISRALQLGRISSATLIANAPAVTEALSLVEAYPQASFGIHLNLTEFSPLTAPHVWNQLGLLDSKGHFNAQIRSCRPSPQLLRAVAREWDAQVCHLSATGFTPSHFDSHHHVHTIAWLLPVLVWLQRRHQVPCLRNTLSVYPETVLIGRRLRAAKGLWSGCSRYLFGSRMPVVFADLDQFWSNPCRREFLEAPGIELMCHPGQGGFERQTSQLLEDGFAPLPAPFKLVPFRQACALAASPRSPAVSPACLQ